MKRLAAIFSLLLSLTTRAQHPNIRFEKIGTREGLSSQQSNCIFQDHLGFIWIGTTFGLNRFDGISCKSYYHNKGDTNSLINNEVLSIAEDRENLLWIGTQEGISCFDPIKEKFTNYSANGKGNYFFPKEYCYTYVDRENNVWIGHNTGISIFRDRAAPAASFSLQLDPPGVRGNRYVISFLHDSKGRFWISTSYGVQQIDIKTLSVIANYFGENKQAITCRQIVEDGSGRIFVGTWGTGIYAFDEVKNEFVPHVLPRGVNNIVHSILPFKEAGIDYLMLGTDASGLIKIKTTDLLNGRALFETMEPDQFNVESLSSNTVLGIISDRAGNIWITTPNGVNKIDPHNQAIRNFSITPFMNVSCWPTNICEDPLDKNNLWISTCGTLGSYNKTTHLFREFETAKKLKYLRDMTRGKNFYWLIASDELVQCDVNMKIVKIYSKGTLPGDLKTSRPYSVYEDHEGKVWIGTVKQGVNVLDPSTGIISKYLDDTTTMHIDGFVNKIMEDSRRNVWIATTGALYRYDRHRDKFEEFRTNKRTEYAALSDNIVALKETKDGKIWIGSRQGLRCYDYMTNSFAEVPIDPGISSYVNGIIEDEQGLLWLGTNNGLVQFNRVSNSFKLYTTLHGLQNNDLTYSFEQDESGNIYIGGPGTLTVFHPVKLLPNQYTAPPLITGIAIDNKTVQVRGKKIVLKYDQSISINFVSLNYTNTENNVYAYQLRGFNKDWVNIGSSRTILFPGLPPGEYTLQLKAANNDGVWDKEITKLDFTITPPFWKTWWFLSLVLVLIAASVYILYRYRLNQLLRMEKMRTRIATDLHDDIGATLSSISFYSEAVKQKAREKLPEVTITLEKMGETSRKMVTSMSDIVWAINPQNDDMEKMLQHMQSYATELCGVKNVQLQVKADERINSLKPRLEQRKNIYLIFKEALNNALKYSQCNSIVLVFRLSNNQFIMQVVDDGHGFDSRKEFGGNGLQNMSRRASEVGGSLTIESDQSGTKVELIVKIT